jgi:hypothetical protein
VANNIVQAEASRLLDASLGTATFTAPTGPMKLALASTTGTNTTAGTEISGGSYGRATITFAAASAGSAATNAVITYSNMPAVTVTGVDIYDSNGTPRRAWWGALTASKTTASGDSLSFASGAITATIA